jgi:putative hydrolase of the HAD superfamily
VGEIRYPGGLEDIDAYAVGVLLRRTERRSVSDFDAVLFDLDGTLCHRTQDSEVMYERVFDRTGETPFGKPDDLWAALSGPPDHDDPVGYYGAGFARMAAQQDRTDVDPLALARALLSLIDDTEVALAPGAREALDAAEEVGPVGVVTNGPADRQRTKLGAIGITDRLATVVFGAELPRAKPHTLPFDRALDALGVEPDRTLYVGNTVEYDVAGGQNAGLAVAWLHDGEDAGAYSPEYVLDSLADLPSVLRGDR